VGDKGSEKEEKQRNENEKDLSPFIASLFCLLLTAIPIVAGCRFSWMLKIALNNTLSPQTVTRVHDKTTTASWRRGRDAPIEKTK